MALGVKTDVELDTFCISFFSGTGLFSLPSRVPNPKFARIGCNHVANYGFDKDTRITNVSSVIQIETFANGRRCRHWANVSIITLAASLSLL